MGQEHKTNETVIEVPPGSAPVKVAAPKGRRKKFPFQGYLDFQGLKIDVENLQGSTRKGTAPDGKAWETIMHWPYGEIRGTEGTDGDKLDCYVGPNGDSPLVVVIHQRVPETGAFDEDKAMLGFNSEEEAVGAYKRQYDHPGFYQDHTAMPIGQFGRWVEDRKNKGKRIVNKSFFSALLSKAMERGGKYLKKLPKPGGGYTYIYAHTKDSPHATAAEHHAHHAKVQNALAQTYEAKAHKEGDADDILSLNNRMKQHHREAARAHHQAASGARRVKKQGLFQRQSEKEHTGGLFAGTPKGEKKTDLFGQSSSGKYAGDRSGKTEQKSEDTRRDTARDSVEKTARTNKLLGQAGLGTDPGKWDKGNVRSAMDKIRREKDSPDKASAMRALNNWGVLKMEGVVKNLKKSLLFGAAFGGDVDLSKGGEGGSHKYIKRIPKPGGGYDYIYSHAQHKASQVQDAKYRDDAHFHGEKVKDYKQVASLAKHAREKARKSGRSGADADAQERQIHSENMAAHHETLKNLHMKGAASKHGEFSTGAKIVEHPSGDGFAVEHVERGNRHSPIGEKGQSRQKAVETAAVILHDDRLEYEKKRDAEKKPKTPQLAPPLPPEAYKPAPKDKKEKKSTGRAEQTEVGDLKKMKGPFKVTDKGAENVYFTDGDGQKRFIKTDTDDEMQKVMGALGAEKPEAKPTPEKSMKLQRTKTKQLPLSFGKSFFLDILEGRSILSKAHKKPGDVVRCGKSGREGAVVRVNDGGYVVKWIDDKGGTGFIADGDVREKGAKKSFTFSAIFHK